MTASRQVVSTASCSQLFTSCYDEFTCGNATVTATSGCCGRTQHSHSNQMYRSPISAEIDSLTSAFKRYPQGSTVNSRSSALRPGTDAVDPPRPPRPLPSGVAGARFLGPVLRAIRVDGRADKVAAVITRHGAAVQHVV
jgi:hypothetical protein